MRRSLPCLLLLLARDRPGACGGDDDDGATAQTHASRRRRPRRSPARPTQREALKDTATKPVIPKPTGSPPRKLVKEDIVKGKGPAAKPGDTLTVNYVGVAFSTGEEFDASWDRGQPFAVPLGAGRVIKGWDRGLVGHAQGRPADAHDPARARLRRRGLPAGDRARTRRSSSWSTPCRSSRLVAPAKLSA